MSVYLDYNATAPLHPQVREAMLEIIGRPLNPSSIHADGRDARKIKEAARAKILQFVNAKNLVFCGSGTEANNLAIQQAVSREQGAVIVSAIEHDSVWKLAPQMPNVKCQMSGVIDLEDLTTQLRNHTTTQPLVSIMLANNETGVIQPVAEAVKIARQFGALVHTDAVQVFGRIPIDFESLGVDMMTISAHKVGGPLGAAALVYRDGLELKPLLRGGGQEGNKRAGTENIAAICGFAESAKCKVQSADLRDYLESSINHHPSTIIHGANAERLPNTTLVSIPNMDAATQLISFDMEGISVSSGAACSSGRVEVSRVLTAMNAPLAKNAIRISTGWGTTKEDIERFLQVWRKLANS